MAVLPDLAASSSSNVVWDEMYSGCTHQLPYDAARPMTACVAAGNLLTPDEWSREALPVHTDSGAHAWRENGTKRIQVLQL